MAVKKIKARYKWQKSLYPLIKIDHLIVKAFTKQNIIYCDNILCCEYIDNVINF